jgi:DNA modification methylase
VLRTLPDASVNCCVTSPPYWGLRDYGHAGQIGLEKTPEQYVAELVAVFREVRRILRPDGVLFLNLGDSYSNDTKWGGSSGGKNYTSAKGGYSGQRRRLTFRPQSYRLRADLTEKEKRHVAMEMFGVRINEDETPGQGPLPEVLPEGSESPEVCGGPDVEGNRVEGKLSTQPGESTCINAGETQAVEVDNHRTAGGEVCVLRGEGAGVSDSGSHQRGRSGAPQGTDRQKQGEQHEDLQGHPQSRLPARQVPGAVLQLQLRDRVLGILSAHTYTADEIPDSARFAFAPVVTLKPKDLVGIPWRVAFALQADGWYLRSEIIWAKPNPMPESVTDRPTKSHEQIFLLSKSPRYYYDAEAIKEPAADPDRETRCEGDNAYRGQAAIRARGKTRRRASKKRGEFSGKTESMPGRNAFRAVTETRNKRDVWTVATQPYSAAHFATFPPALIQPCILAGCPAKACAACGAPWERVVERESHTDRPQSRPLKTRGNQPSLCASIGQPQQGGRYTKSNTIGFRPTCTCNAATQPGTVLDPFGGSGTTGQVAAGNARNAVLIELNTEYTKLAQDRCGLFCGKNQQVEPW